MARHDSTVNYRNLIRDLAEMYPFEVSDVVVVELVANALDADATQISIDYDSEARRLVVSDNGTGMSASQFEEYHDFAAGLKTRGSGIGFAGVGAKISFNVADRVLTETRSNSFKGGSDWHFVSGKKLVWEDVRPVRMRGHGTRVEVQFGKGAKVSYSTTDDLVHLIKRHYLPLLDTDFLDLYARMGHYSADLRFRVNGSLVKPFEVAREFSLEKVRKFFPQKGKRRIGYGVLGLASSDYPLGPELAGVLLCTHGKVVRSDLFNQFPGAHGPRIFGLVEIPNFVNFLTTAKTDFIRGRGKHREFEGYYDPVRQEFRSWLAEVGVQPLEIAEPDEASRLERELKKILEDVPELSEFFGFRIRKSVLHGDEAGSVSTIVHDGVEVTFPVGEGAAGQGPGPVDVGEEPGQALQRDDAGTERATPISRTGRRGPRIAFAEALDRLDLAWVDGNSVVINTGHPAYAKARSDTLAWRFHCLFAIGGAVQKFLTSGGDTADLLFIDRMMAAWGSK